MKLALSSLLLGAAVLAAAPAEAACIKGKAPFDVPECGVGSIVRNRSMVARALGDLVDGAQGDATCRTENVRISVNQLLEIVASFPGTFAEGGALESLQTDPPQPPTPGVGNSTLLADQLSLLDVLRAVEVKHNKKTLPIWANSCWQPGDASGRVDGIGGTVAAQAGARTLAAPLAKCRAGPPAPSRSRGPGPRDWVAGAVRDDFDHAERPAAHRIISASFVDTASA